MLSGIAEAYVRLMDSFQAVFGLVAQLFVTRPWLLPVVPVVLMVVLFGLRARRHAPPAPSGDDLQVARRRIQP